jgi:hypothetical protein
MTPMNTPDVSGSDVPADDPLAMTANFVMVGAIVFLAAATANVLVKQLFGDNEREDARTR